MEQLAYGMLARTPDAQEAVTAFTEKRRLTRPGASEPPKAPQPGPAPGLSPTQSYFGAADQHAAAVQADVDAPVARDGQVARVDAGRAEVVRGDADAADEHPPRVGQHHLVAAPRVSDGRRGGSAAASDTRTQVRQ